VDGKLLTDEELQANATKLGRILLTRGMIGCYLSHRRCWQKCVESGEAIIVFEDDVVLASDFSSQLASAFAVAPADWDVLLLGALGCVHPDLNYGPSFLHGLVSGGARFPRKLGDGRLHVPMRPFGTHAYALSPRGAAKLLSTCPKANFHVDVAAWGQPQLNLFCVHPLLAKQTHDDTTIGGIDDRSWLPPFMFKVDEYTGVSPAWAWNAPIMQLGGSTGILLTSGRALASALCSVAIAALARSPLLLSLAGGWITTMFVVIRLLSCQRALPLTLPPAEPAAYP